jgi:tRNA G46 methylase TrmB
MEQQQQHQNQQQNHNDNDNDNDNGNKLLSSSSSSEYKYNPRKPKWWNKLGNNGRGATKAQKRCMRKILDGDNNNNGNGTNGTDDSTTEAGTAAAAAAAAADGGGGGLKLKLRLPTVEYGSKLNWDDVFDDAADNDNGNDNGDDTSNDNGDDNKESSTRDIWLELGFGRGENISSLLDLKLLNPNNNNNNKNTSSNSNNFYLIGAEVSSIGIGCLCKRIDQRFNNNKNKIKNNNNTDTIDKKDVDVNDSDNANDQGYVLYQPQLDPYSNHHNEDEDEVDEDGKVIVDEHNNNNNNNNNNEKEKEKEKEKNQYNNEISDNVHDDHELSLQLKLLQNHFRIHTGDGYKLLFKIPTDSLANILITFPDPFEKNNDTQYRLIQKQTLLECYRILRKNNNNNNNNSSNSNSNSNDDNKNYNGLLYLATDHDGYYDWCHQMIYEVNNNHNINDNGNGNGNDDNSNDNDGNDTVRSQPQIPLFRLIEPCPNRKNWLPAISRYEQKGWTEGRSTKLSCWQVVIQ